MLTTLPPIHKQLRTFVGPPTIYLAKVSCLSVPVPVPGSESAHPSGTGSTLTCLVSRDAPPVACVAQQEAVSSTNCYPVNWEQLSGPPTVV
ncbi:hypothetical protein NXS19_012182 [Fusarium pseudograminearum]|nr:hypothetical protein NXS19_012182 [Fusarium pseudograminearum]